MEEEDEGRKGAGSAEEKEDEGRGKKDMQEKLSKLFSQPADPWASAGVCAVCSINACHIFSVASSLYSRFLIKL